MGEKYGSMSGNNLEKAICDQRNNTGKVHGNGAPNRFLKSVRAACNDLPHTNEATQMARQKYFGLPMLQWIGLTADATRAAAVHMNNVKLIVSTQ